MINDSSVIQTKYKNLKVDLYMYMTHISMKTLYQIFFVLLQGRKLSKTRKTYGKRYMRSTELYVSVTRLTHMLLTVSIYPQIQCI